MFDLPIVTVKSRNSNLDFLDHKLIKFTNNSVGFGAVNALPMLDESPERQVSHDQIIVNNLSS